RRSATRRVRLAPRGGGASGRPPPAARAGAGDRSALRASPDGFPVPFGQPLDEAFDAALAHDLLELAAIGEDEAHALDGDVVDLPALGRLVHRVLDRGRRA